MRVTLATKNNFVEIDAKNERFSTLAEIDEALRALRMARRWFVKQGKAK